MTDLPPPAGREPAPARSGPPAFNEVPAVVLGLAALIVLVQALDWWSTTAGQGWAHAVALWLGAVRTGAASAELPPAPVFGLTPYVLHVFVHFGWLHAVMNLGALLAFGAAAARPFGAGLKGAVGFLAFFFTCAIAGAALSVAIRTGESTLMVGASTALSGVIAGAGWAYGGMKGMLRIALPWLGVNLALALVEPLFRLPIAWDGHLGGLIMGMIAYPLFVGAFAGRRA